MQVANTLNNTIRILFNPKIEKFKLFDFLIVKSDDIRYIAEIIEIYDDKFDASQNVAKIKLFYRITENNEVMPYDNFTPNKECEIIKIKQEEIETFINQDKETFIFGTNTKSSTSLQVQYSFFDNNAVVLADKVENANSITYNLAKNLSTKKNVVIIDSTGILEYEDAKIIKAGKNFRMPLDYTTIDYIFDKCLMDASLEFQSVCGAILNEIKKFAKKQEMGFIPFTLFTKVILEQYKATPYPELKLLLTRLKRFQMDDIFAKNKSDKENLNKAISKNKITILDISGINTFWQKSYIEYIISEIQEEIYLLTRINDEHFDSELINKIYNNKNNIKFVPNVSYNYKKLPTVMQYCKNYILLPSLYQRNDFLDANFALSNLISDGCIIFGDDTDNFLYLATDYELDSQAKRKNYRKIALSMMEQEDDEEEEKVEEQKETFEIDNITTDSEKLIKELSDFESQQQESIKQKEFEKNLEEKKIIEENFKKSVGINEEDTKENFIDNSRDEKPTTPPVVEEHVFVEKKQEENGSNNQDIEDIFEKKEAKIEIKFDTDDEFQDIIPNQEKSEEPVISDDIIEEDDDDDVFSNSLNNDKNEEDDKNNINVIEKNDVTYENNENKDTIIIDENENENTNKFIIQDDDDAFIINNEEEISNNDTQNISISEDDNISLTDNINIQTDIVETKKIDNEDNKPKIPTRKDTFEDIIPMEETDSSIPTISIKDEEDNKIEETNSNEKLISEKVEIENSTEDIDLSDEELDFFQIAQESANEYDEEDNTIEEKNQDDKSNLINKNDENTEDDIDLNEIAKNSINDSFNNIINTKSEESAPTIKINDKTNIPIKNIEKKENLPIFKDNNPQDKKLIRYSIGNVIIHKKYGKGTVVKTIKYEERQLLQIEFETAGKKLLDPTVADIKLEQ